MSTKPDIRKARELLAVQAKRNSEDLRFYLAAAVLAENPIRKSTMPKELRPLFEKTRRDRFQPGYKPVPHRLKNSDDEYVLKAMAKLMLQEYILRPGVWLDEAIESILGKSKDVIPVAKAARDAATKAPKDLHPTGPRSLAVKFAADREYYTLWAADEIFAETVLKTRKKKLF